MTFRQSGPQLANSSFQQALTTSFSNPFTSIAARWMPTNIKDMFKVAEWMYRYSGIFSSAIDRTARIFVTSFHYDINENNTSHEYIKEFLEVTGGFKRSLIEIGTDLLLYGNSFVSLYLPFKRMVRCPSCRRNYVSDQVDNLNYHPDAGFTGDCYCGAKEVNFEYRDIPLKDINKINIIRWNPKQIDFVYNPISGKYRYNYTMDSKTVQKFKEGKGTHLIHDTPVVFLDAAHRDKVLTFREDELLHIKQSTLAGQDIEWGMPPSISCFPIIFYIAVLRKANEAIGMDYIVPLRILFPKSNTSSQEAGIMNLGNFAGRIESIIRSHRQDPADWHVAPTPVGYEVIGGEKRSLMVSDDIRLSTEELLHSLGFPAELFYGTLRLDATPMALRLLENTFGLSETYNLVTKWIVGKVTKYLGIEEIDVSVPPIRWADDIERRQVLLNLAGANKISDTTMLEMYGADFEDEERKKLEQMQIVQKIQDEADKKLAETSAMGGGEEGAGQMGGTPMDIMQTAQAEAQRMLSIPYEVRRSELDKMNKTHPLLHSAVLKAMDQMRNQMKTQGGQQMMMQMQQQGGMM